MSERREFVLGASPSRAIWSLAWPIVVSNQLSFFALGVLLFWLGRMIGENGLAVESLFRPFSLLVLWAFASTSVGASALVSRSIGASSGRGLRIAAQSVNLTVALWLVLAAVVIPCSPWLADWLAGGLAIHRPMLHFLLAWWLVALPGLAVLEVLLEIANATGSTKLNLLRVIVDFAVIAGLAPLLMLCFGIAGGPIAEGVAALGLVIVVWFAMTRHADVLGLGKLGAGTWRSSRVLWKELLAIGVPAQVGRMAMFAAQVPRSVPVPARDLRDRREGLQAGRRARSERGARRHDRPPARRARQRRARARVRGPHRARRVQTALELVELGHRAGSRPRQLSGGEEQRVAIARTIVNDPALILADEPTGDLDAQSAQGVLGLLALLNQSFKKTIIMVTHDPGAARYAHRTMYLQKGTFYEVQPAIA